jgi:hypothetical protein
VWNNRKGAKTEEKYKDEKRKKVDSMGVFILENIS